MKRFANPIGMRLIASDSRTVTVELTQDELVALNNALNEVCNGPDAIEDWEFSTRLAVERTEAEDLLTAVGSLLAG
jgi:hypothetical protein